MQHIPFDLISAPFAVKMSPKPSLPQSRHSVQLVLTGNTLNALSSFMKRCVRSFTPYGGFAIMIAAWLAVPSFASQFEPVAMNRIY
jgi:hypothetical protein